jgi:hypothetical protein
VGGGGLTPADQVELDEVLEVATDGGGRQAELLGEGGRGDRAALADRLEDPVARARLQGVRRGRNILAVLSSDKHNTDVT